MLVFIAYRLLVAKHKGKRLHNYKASGPIQ